MNLGKFLSSFLMMAGTFMIFSGFFLYNTGERSSVGFIFLGILELIFAILWKASIAKRIRLEKQKQDEVEKARQKAEWSGKLVEFYKDLCKSKCVELNTKAKKEKAKLIAKKYTTLHSDEHLKELIISAKREYDLIIEQERQTELREVLEEEKEFYEDTIRYAFLYGREKRKQYVLEELYEYMDDEDYHSKTASYARNVAMNVNTLTGANRDWSVAGGIASAIAGPAAGIATAIDVQNKNALAQQRADELRSSAISLTVQHEMLAHGDANMIKKLQKEISDIESKLVADENQEKLFELICPTVKNQSVTETGALMATISIKAAKTKIYDEVDAVVDGTIMGEIFSNGKLVDQMIFCLNKSGSLRSDSISGICITLKDPNASYELVLKPNKLWAIEI